MFLMVYLRVWRGGGAAPQKPGCPSMTPTSSISSLREEEPRSSSSSASRYVRTGARTRVCAYIHVYMGCWFVLGKARSLTIHERPSMTVFISFRHQILSEERKPLNRGPQITIILIVLITRNRHFLRSTSTVAGSGTSTPKQQPDPAFQLVHPARLLKVLARLRVTCKTLNLI